MTAASEEKRDDADRRRAFGSERFGGRTEVGREHLQIRELDASAGRGSAHPLHDPHEGLGPPRVAGAVGEENDGRARPALTLSRASPDIAARPYVMT